MCSARIWDVTARLGRRPGGDYRDALSTGFSGCSGAPGMQRLAHRRLDHRLSAVRFGAAVGGGEPTVGRDRLCFVRAVDRPTGLGATLVAPALLRGRPLPRLDSHLRDHAAVDRRVRSALRLPFRMAGGTFSVGRRLLSPPAGLWNAYTRIGKSQVSPETSTISGKSFLVGMIFGRTFIPVGAHPHTALVLVTLAAVLGVGLAVCLRASGEVDGEPQWGLRKWLVLAAGGLVIAVLGWAMFIPANPYYTPSRMASPIG